MDFRSFLAGVLAAYGAVNLLAVFKIGIFVAMPIMLLGYDVGNIVLSLLALLIAYYLVRGN
jgi:hypothetical protein